MNTNHKEIPFSKVNKDRLIPANAFLQESLKDPVVKKAFNEEEARLHIADMIKEHRKSLKMTQADLAKKAKTSQRTVSKLENGQFSVGFDLLQKIASVLGLRIDLLPKYA
jgi:DNA-binding XRE family transcriptional regulator